MRARLPVGPACRERYRVFLCGPGRFYRDGGCELARVEAGVPVVVPGWKVDLLPAFDVFCLEADGGVTAVEVVWLDPTAPVRMVAGYRRPDGSMV